MNSIFQDAEECEILLKESEGDQETKDMVEEELKELQESLDSMDEEILENLLEPEKFDDCTSATIEFRPGKS
jgi:protein subunit release factor A